MTAGAPQAHVATFLSSPFQAWLRERGLADGEVAAWVGFSNPVQDDLLKKVIDVVGLSRVELVADIARGAVLRQDPSTRTLRATRHEPDGLAVELRMPWGIADATTLRRIQEIVADIHAGAPLDPIDPSLGMRFAHWQRSLAERAGTAVGTVVPDGATTSLEQLPMPGSTGRWTERQVPATVTARLTADPGRLGPLHAVLLGAWRHVLSRTADGPVTVWTGLDARRGAIPLATLGQLTIVRPWRPERSPTVAEAIADAAAWVDVTLAEPLGWQERPAGLPPYGFQEVPGRLVRGDAVLEPPRVAPWVERMLLAVSVAADSSIDVSLWHADLVAGADADELLEAYVRVLKQLADGPGHGDPVLAGTRPPIVHGLDPLQPSVWSHVLRHGASRPDAVAVADAAGQTTYGSLVDRASAVADLLRERGVGPETKVVVHMAESVDQVVALLGVTAAGAAYVPVGAHLPARRVAELSELSGAVLALTDDAAGAARTGLPALERPAFAGGAPRTAPPVDLEAELDASTLAYVLHTSGSTGRPKGVMATRRGLAAYVSAALDLYGVGPQDTVLTQTSPMFDLSVTSLLMPLAAGACVEIVDPQSGIDGLVRAVRRVRDVALLKLTPAHLSLLATVGLSADDASIRRVVVGGEQLRTDVALAWQARFPACAVVNEYGPTETVVGVTVRQIGPGDVGTAAVPIGEAVPGTWVSVCDEDGQPLEDGIPGEVVIGGATVARGYVGDPRQTAERFVPDVSGPPGARAYCTGDVAVATKSRGLLFRGRSDRQISLQGYRVEPAEVERALLDVTGVRAAAVVSASSLAGGTVG